MEINNHKVNDVMIISVIGSIDAITADEVSESINLQIANNEVKLVMDFSRVNYTSSAGLRVLLGAIKETRARNGDIRLASLLPDVSKVLTLSGFTNIMNIYPNLDTAIKSYT